MCSIILPIHPRYAEKILSGEKKVEYRRTKLKRKPDKIIIYATAPISKIVGEVVVTDIIVTELSELWDKTKKYSGVDEEYFKKYYERKKKGVAYSLGKVTKYSQYKGIQEYGLTSAPQSAVYQRE